MSEENKKENDLYVDELPAVGKRMYVPCKKCERDRYHTILAHKTETSAQIECEVCKGKKSFSLKKTKTGKGRVITSRARAPKKTDEEVAKEAWADLKDQAGGSAESVTYKMTEKFEINAIIDHKKFGLGFVTASSGHKITVAFEDAQRDLVHNR